MTVTAEDFDYLDHRIINLEMDYEVLEKRLNDLEKQLITKVQID